MNANEQKILQCITLYKQSMGDLLQLSEYQLLYQMLGGFLYNPMRQPIPLYILFLVVVSILPYVNIILL